MTITGNNFAPGQTPPGPLVTTPRCTEADWWLVDVSSWPSVSAWWLVTHPAPSNKWQVAASVPRVASVATRGGKAEYQSWHQYEPNDYNLNTFTINTSFSHFTSSLILSRQQSWNDLNFHHVSDIVVLYIFASVFAENLFHSADPTSNWCCCCEDHGRRLPQPHVCDSLRLRQKQFGQKLKTLPSFPRGHLFQIL